MDMNDPNNEYITIPFVLTEAQGGDYNTEAFTAGWSLGILDIRLSIANTADMILHPMIFPVAWQNQIDLIAMSHSMLVRVIPLPEDPGYACFIFGDSEFFKTDIG